MGLSSSKAKLNRIRKEKVDDRNLQISNSLKVLEQAAAQLKIDQQKIDRVTRLPLQQIVQMLNSYKITSKELTVIYCIRTAKIGKRLELITQVNFDNALRMAEERDQTRKLSKKTNWTFKDKSYQNNQSDQDQDQDKYLPPLFGIPISLKDSFDMDGLSSTIGITSRVNDLKKDGVFVKALKQAGLIPFVKSNLAQLAMSFESFNYIWGRSRNPWNEARSAGGSSGGQGGLIAARCSPLGVGSDVGGSVRIPSEFNGIFGLKPSETRLSNWYQTEYSTATAGMDTIKVVIGPLSNSVQGLALWMKTVTDEKYYQSEHDPFSKNIPFNDEIYREHKENKKKLRVGYFKSFKFLQTTKASQRAVQQVVEQIEALGHEAVPVEIPNVKEMIGQFIAEISAEGGCKTWRDMLGEEELAPEYSQAKALSQMSWMTLALTKMYYNYFMPRIGFLLESSRKLTVFQYLQHDGRVHELRKKFVDYWREKKLDLLLAPGQGCQALLHGYAPNLFATICYTFVWNLIGVPSGAMPVTLCRQQEEAYESLHKDTITQQLKKTAKGTAGLPVGVQIIGLPFEQEKVLGLMSSLSDRIKFHEKNPLPNINQ